MNKIFTPFAKNIQRTMKFKLIGLIFGVLWMSSCVPVPEDNQEEVVIDIADETVQKIYGLQNRQSIDSLKSFFQHKSATYRYLAASAFSSIQDLSLIHI